MLGFDGARTVHRAQSRPQSSSARDRQKCKHWGPEWALKGWGRHVATEWRVNLKKINGVSLFLLSWLFSSLNFNRSNWKLVFFHGLEQLRNWCTIIRSANAWSKDLPGWSTACNYVPPATLSKKMHILPFVSTFKDRMTPYRYKLCCRMSRAWKANMNIVFHFIFALD